MLTIEGWALLVSTAAAFFSGLAVIVAVLANRQSRKTAADQLELERITAELSKKQIKQIEDQESQKYRADFLVTFVHVGRGRWHFVVENRGEGTALDFSFHLIDCRSSPLRDGIDEVSRQKVKPRSKVTIPAVVALSDPASYTVRLNWTEQDGLLRTEDFHVSIHDGEQG